MLQFQLHKQLRDFALDIDLALGNETLVLIGRSGSGKSTVLKLLAGLLTPDRGSIELNDRPLWQTHGVHLPPEERHIVIVFQNYALFPHLSVADNIAYGLFRLPKSERAARIAEAMALLNLQHLAQARPSALSGGEQQRVALARALVTRPKLLLLDEPLSALDVSLRSHVRHELKTLLQNLRIPTLVVTHDYEDARVLADRIAVLQGGQIIQAGSPQAIAQFPANRFVADFVGTNWLAANAAATAVLSFDPWRVRLSKTPSTAVYEWHGQICDIARLGGFARLTLQTEVANARQPILADLPIAQLEAANYQLGDHVFASLAPEDVRTTETARTSALENATETATDATETGQINHVQ